MQDPAKSIPEPERAGMSTSGPRENWPMNCWWVVAHKSEVTDKAVLRWVMGLPVAVYRRENGDPVALHDRCPHRWAPLHKGEVCGDHLVCPYHGVEFDPSGACAKVPTQSTIPGAMKVRSFPAAERYGFIWIWTGDLEAADPDKIPADLAYLEDPSWEMVWGYKFVEANYMQLKENVLDLTHFAFLHKNSLGVSDWGRPPKVEITDDKITYRQLFDMAPLPPIYAGPAGKPVGKLVNRDNWGSFLTPAAHHGAVDMHDPAPGPEGLERFSLRVIHLTTPVSIGKTHYYWAMARDHGAPFDYEKTRAGADIVFGEDIEIVEAVQAIAQRSSDMDDAIEVSLVADQAAVQSRRKVEAMIAAERKGSTGG